MFEAIVKYWTHGDTWAKNNYGIESHYIITEYVA